MNIIYIAYSCAPYRGSEEKIGWSIPLESAKTNHVFVFTKEEHRNAIEKYLQTNSVENISFYYVDIPDFLKKIFKGPFYSGRLNFWHKQAYKLVKQVCNTNKIDVIHQITPIEFRSIGTYGKIDNVPFICGPLGGGEYIPKELSSYADTHLVVEAVRKLANTYYKYIYKINKKLSLCKYILFANRETKEYLSNITDCKVESEILTEIGIDSNFQRKRNKNHPKCIFMVAGRLIYRKGHALLIDALSGIPKEFDYECRIIGDGPEIEKLKKQCGNSDISNRVVFTGEIPFTEMKLEYEKADIFIMPSLRETTGSVLLEAMSYGLPIITINKFGGAMLVNENIGWLYDGTSKEDYVENLKKILIQCIKNPQEVEYKGNNALNYVKKFTWAEKCKIYNEIYRR